MPIPVHALAHRPLPAEALAELVTLPYVSPVEEDDEGMVNDTSLKGSVEGWEQVPGRRGMRPATDPDPRPVRRRGPPRPSHPSPALLHPSRAPDLPPACTGTPPCGEHPLADWITAHANW
ncbi:MULTISPECIES: hypothetical protein [unclassified Streptomyces]|uniref:hypothetical protein n=1 Tax=unclassified Streptomyces TaxID=2593676 RepID=UPI0033197EEF